MGSTLTPASPSNLSETKTQPNLVAIYVHRAMQLSNPRSLLWPVSRFEPSEVTLPLDSLLYWYWRPLARAEDEANVYRMNIDSQRGSAYNTFIDCETILILCFRTSSPCCVCWSACIWIVITYATESWWASHPATGWAPCPCLFTPYPCPASSKWSWIYSRTPRLSAASWVSGKACIYDIPCCSRSCRGPVGWIKGDERCPYTSEFIF